jgi:hypothetical protein
MKRKITVFLALILLLGLFACGREPIETYEFEPSNRGNTIFNLFNGGIAATDGEWIYFDKFSLELPIEERGIYKIRMDLTGETRISDAWTRYINVLDGWVYFYSMYMWDDERRGIYRIRTDGTEITHLIDTQPYNLTVIGDWIYYAETDDEGVYRLRTDGSERQRILDRAWVFIIDDDGDWIYYDSINRIRTDGTDEMQIYDERNFLHAVGDDWVYFVDYYDRNLLYRIRTDGSTEKELVVDSRMVSWIRDIYAVEDDWIYFISSWDYNNFAGALFKMRTDGSDVRIFNRGHRHRADGFAFVGDFIHYFGEENFFNVFEPMADWEPCTIDWENIY